MRPRKMDSKTSRQGERTDGDSVSTSLDKQDSPGPRKEQVLGYKPLYSQVRDILVRRLADGRWHSGEVLPSEFQLAEELGVSQGTVRKALDSMTVDRLLVRHQGRGTFVAEYDEARILFHFFKLMPDGGPAAFPTSRVFSVKESSANAKEMERLALSKKDRVIRINRVRLLEEEPAIVESISVPAALFPGLLDQEMPNNLYGLYARAFGVKIGRARERIKAVTLNADIARRLNAAPGAAALQIDRVAQDLENRPIEWRLSICLTERIHYLSDLR
jgi:GntR family transcriptional regulator